MPGMRNMDSHDLETRSVSNDDQFDAASTFTQTPVDGYFTERRHPRQTFVQNPSMSTAEDSKAHEAAEQQRSSSAAGELSPLSSPAISLRSRSLSEESLPRILDAGPAPPDYAAATAHRREPSSGTYQDSSPHPSDLGAGVGMSYGSVGGDQARPSSEDQHSGQNWPFGNRNNPLGSGFPFNQGNDPFGPGVPSHQPFRAPNNGPNLYPSGVPVQSMSDPIHADIDVDERTTLFRWNRPPQRRRGNWLNRTFCKPRSWSGVLIAIAIVVLIIFVAKYSHRTSDSSDGHTKDGNNKHNDKGEPVKIPSSPDDSNGGNGDQDSTSPYYPFPPDLPSHSSCALDFRTDTVAFEFQNPGSFFFVESVEEMSLKSGKINGNMLVRPARREQKADIMLYVSIATSSPWRIASLDYVQTATSFILKTPKIDIMESSHSSKPCMEIYAWMEVRKGVELDDLGIETKHLDINLDEGLVDPESTEPDHFHLRVKGLANFSSISNIVSSQYWSSRETIIRTISGDVKGTYALRDRLSIFTYSGDVSVDVDPKPVEKAAPAPAVFTVETLSGAVSVTHLLGGGIPERVYTTSVKSKSADISGSFILGKDTTFSSTSGDIIVDLFPFHREDSNPVLSTSSVSGTLNLKIMSPYVLAWTKSWRPLHHRASSVSGDTDIIYPPEWEGRIDATTISGDISVQGKGVRKIVDEQLLWQRHFVAVKGDGDGKLNLAATSGDIRVVFGY